MEQGSNAELLLENSVGNLQHRPFVHDLPAAPGVMKHRIDYRAYDPIFKKPANTGTTLYWSPTGALAMGVAMGGAGQPPPACSPDVARPMYGAVLGGAGRLLRVLPPHPPGRQDYRKPAVQCVMFLM